MAPSNCIDTKSHVALHMGTCACCKSDIAIYGIIYSTATNHHKNFSCFMTIIC